MEEEIKYYLYKITNRVNGKMYIGITKNPDKRRNQHLYSRSISKKNYPIRLAVEKYGAENFSFEVLCIGNEEYIYDLERKAIAAYGTVRNGYNISVGGKGGEGSRVKSRKDDKPLYVSEFWFPNRRTCMEAMGLSPSTLHGWKVSGKLGSAVKLKLNSKVNIPVYVGSFWFPDIFHAVKYLNKNIGILSHRIKTGQIEQKVRNPGIGKRKLSVEGVIYESFADAARSSPYTKKMLINRIVKYPDKFYYIQEETK